MVSRKKMANGPTSEVAIPAPVPISKLSPSLRFLLVVFSNLFLTASLVSLTTEFTAGDVSSVSRHVEGWGEILGLLGWRAAEIAVAWVAEYDNVDVASLVVLSHMPHLYLLTTFYGVRPTTMLATLSVDVLATYIPFRLLRNVSPTHQAEAPKGAVANRSLLTDSMIKVFTMVLPASIYAVVVFGSFGSWLPIYLVTHFDGLKDISAAHSAALPYLILSFLPFGYAAREFLFTPTIGAKPDLGDAKASAFNPETATLSETIYYNIWGYSKRTKSLIKRTATLVAIGSFNTWLQTYVTIEGAEAYGAAGWASVWALAATITGMAFWWVGDVEGVTN